MIDISLRDVPLDDDDWAPPLPETDGSVDSWGSTEPSEGPTPIVAQAGREGNLRDGGGRERLKAEKRVPESRTPLRNVG